MAFFLAGDNTGAVCNSQILKEDQMIFHEIESYDMPVFALIDFVKL